MRHWFGFIALCAALLGGCSGLWEPFLGAVPENDGGGGGGDGGTGADLAAVANVACLPSDRVRQTGGAVVQAVVTTTTLNGVWGAADDSVWAVGGGGLILHWDGDGWQAEHDGGSQLHAVWGVPGEAYVVTAGRDSTILHRLSTGAWSADMVTTASSTLQDVRGTGSAFQLAAGLGGVVLSNSGALWTPSELKPGSTLSVNAIAVQSPTRVALAGVDTATGGGFVGMYDYAALSWTESWKRPTSDPVYGLILVGTAVWAAGASGSLTRYSASGGEAPMPSSVVLTTRRLRPALTTGHFWLVGDGGQIHYWDGTALGARASGTDRTLFDAWQAPGGVLWVVGQNGTLLRCAPPG